MQSNNRPALPMPHADHQSSLLTLLGDLLAKAERAGAEAADALLSEATSLSASWRMGRPEDIKRAESRDLGLRVLIGRHQAFVSSSDCSPEALDALAERAVAMARSTPEDRYCGLADADLLAERWPDLDLLDPAEPSVETLVERCRIAEEAALAVPGVTNSEGAGSSWVGATIALAASNGFSGVYSGTRHVVSASVIAGSGTGMERDYDFSVSRHFADLGDPAAIGRSAGERAVERLNPRKMPSRQAPVVFAARVAHSLLGHFAGAISGAAVSRGTSFLKDRLDQPVFGPGIRVIDDPHRHRGLSSRPFDAEGVANRRRALIEDGRLTTWLLDCASARQLGLTSTGHAARGTASPPTPAASNLYLEPGQVTVEEMIGDIDQGFYVTDLIGFGVNGVTGDYSRGAAGFWIENGRIAYPVSELTIAGNLKDMFLRITPANDLVFKYGTDSPTVRIDGMTVAGR